MEHTQRMREERLRKFLYNHLKDLDFHSARESNKGEKFVWNTPIMNEFIAFADEVSRATAKEFISYLMQETIHDFGYTPSVVYIEPYNKEPNEKDVSGFSYGGNFLNLIHRYLTSDELQRLEKRNLKNSEPKGSTHNSD